MTTTVTLTHTETATDLEDLRLPELQARYAEVLGEETRCPNRRYLIRRITEALEARAAESEAETAGESEAEAETREAPAQPAPQATDADAEAGADASAEAESTPAPEAERPKLTQLTVEQLREILDATAAPCYAGPEAWMGALEMLFLRSTVPRRTGGPALGAWLGVLLALPLACSEEPGGRDAGAPDAAAEHTAEADATSEGDAPVGDAAGWDDPLDALLASTRGALYVGAHPDDENALGAVLARARELAGSLHMVSMTRGENPDNAAAGSEWHGLHRGTEVGQARAEAFATAAALLRASFDLGPFVNGPQSLEELDAHPPDAPHVGWDAPGYPGTPEGVIEKWTRDGGDPVRFLVGVLRRVRPEVVLTWDGYCGATGNDEHVAVSWLVDRAVQAAADPEAYPELGEAHRVVHLVHSAVLARWLQCDGCRELCTECPPPLRPETCRRCREDCTLCARAKCSGSIPEDPPHRWDARRPSALFGTSYFQVACRLAKSYENLALQRGWSQADIEAQCAALERDAPPEASLVAVRIVR